MGKTNYSQVTKVNQTVKQFCCNYFDIDNKYFLKF